MESSVVLPTTQFAYRKGLGTCDTLSFVSHTQQSAWKIVKEARIVQIDFSAAFDKVNHQGILYKLCAVGIVCFVLSILTQLLSNRSQHVMVDGCRSKRYIRSATWQCFGPVIVPLVHFGAFSILENKLIGYADDSTLMAVMPSPGVRVTIAESPSHDLGRVSERCNLWGMKFNATKTNTMIVPRSRTMHPQSSTLAIGGTVLKESDDLVILGVTFDSKMTFEKHLRSAVLCMLYKIRCSPVHPLNDALPGPYVPVRVTRGALVAHRYTHAPPRCRTSQYRMTFILIPVSVWNDVTNPLFDGF